MTTTNYASGYVPRLVDRVIPELVSGLPAISLVGPRGAGKTTTARRYARSVARLNQPSEAGVFRADPDTALRLLSRPALLDEWQVVPDVLGAVKRVVDDDPRAGQFLLTGSVRATFEQTWPATGRVARVPVFGLTVREQYQGTGGELFLDRLPRDSVDLLAPAPEQADLTTYLELSLRGGFPDAVLHRDGRARRTWLTSYHAELLASDVAMTGGAPDPRKLATYVEALAAHSAGVVEDVTLFDAARIGRSTANAYEAMLQSVFFCEQVPAWWSDRLTRLTATPKRYLLDTSLMLSILRLDLAGMMRDVAMVGRVLDTFVAMQLRPECAVTEAEPRLFHLRDKGGRHEVDLVVEYPAGLVAGIEIKATAAPSSSDVRHLAWLRDQLDDRFVAGVLLHTGPHTFRLGDRIIAAPISTLWAG